MTWPKPVPGLVVRYSYLWREEKLRGRDEGVKDRPSAVAIVVKGSMVRVLPIMHSPPTDPRDALEIPLPTKRRLGLDSERSWVVLSEANEFLWPGPDLRFAQGGGPESAVYGKLPETFMRDVRDRLLGQMKGGTHKVVRRTS